MSHPFTFRPGTSDEETFQTVWASNEYLLPESFGPDDIIVDIGTHIGSFSYSALMRGAGLVHGFEAYTENYKLASKHLQSFGDRVRLHNKAVWRSDRPVKSLHYDLNPSNPGGGNVFLSSLGQEIDVIAFDDLILNVTRGGRSRVRMLKIDCEGSEFPILFTSRTLHLIDSIAGEFHGFGYETGTHYIPENAKVDGYERYTIREITDFLQRQGFQVRSTRHPQYPHVPTGLFFATRESRSVPMGSRIRAKWQLLRRKMSNLRAAG